MNLGGGNFIESWGLFFHPVRFGRVIESFVLDLLLLLDDVETLMDEGEILFMVIIIVKIYEENGKLKF